MEKLVNEAVFNAVKNEDLNLEFFDGKTAPVRSSVKKLFRYINKMEVEEILSLIKKYEGMYINRNRAYTTSQEAVDFNGHMQNLCWCYTALERKGLVKTTFNSEKWILDNTEEEKIKEVKAPLTVNAEEVQSFIRKNVSTIKVFDIDEEGFKSPSNIKSIDFSGKIIKIRSGYQIESDNQIWRVTK